MKKVYLAGGFLSNWQESVCKLGGFEFYNPRIKEKDPKDGYDMSSSEYVAWDLHHIKESDIVFVYAEATNNSCIGLSVECGYAKGLGKTVILVVEPNNLTIKDKYLDFLRKTSDVCFDNITDGMRFLKSFQ